MINTLLVILEQSLLHLPLMVGAYISFSLLQIPDLSIESAYVVGAIMSSYIILGTTHIPGITLILALIASCLGGALVGLVSSLLSQRAGFPHLLSSIITIGLFHGFNQMISPVYVSLNRAPNTLTLLAIMPQHPELFILLIIGIVIGCSIYYLLTTQIGYSFAVFGDNPYFFKNYSISTSFVSIVGIVFANALAGVSGYLFAQSNSFVELNMGMGKTLLCITILILGKAIMRIMHMNQSFSVIIPLFGTAAYFTLQQLLLKVGFNLKYFTAVQALLILIVLLYTYRHNRNQTTHDNLGV